MNRLQLFGQPALRGPTGDVVNGGASQRQRLALLALLALAGESGVGRDRLIALLWPELDTERGRHLLSNSVYVIRKALGFDVVVARGDVLSLNAAQVRSDVADFAEALDRGDDVAAVALSSAPFLDGFYLPDAGEFERWVESERGRLARARSDALERLAAREQAAGHARSAIEYWKQLAQDEPYNSRAVLRIMQSYASRGEPAAAIELARRHQKRLAEDLDASLPDDIATLVFQLSRHGTKAESRPVAREAAVSQTAQHLFRTSAPPDRSVPDGNPAPATTERHLRTWRPPAAVMALLVVSAVSVAAIVRGGPLTDPPAPAAAAAAAQSIAVLPFVNLGPERSDDYFSDGLTEELINHLVRVKGLRVAARTSAFAYKGVNEHVSEIARKLNVSMVVEGSVRRTGDRLRITVQLVNAADGYHIWSRTWDEEDLRDIFRIQDEISRQIVMSVLPSVGDATTTHRGTADVRAYEEYLRGRYVFWQGTSVDNMQTAIRHYEAAIALDPNYALAYAGLADAYMLLPGPPKSKMEKAKAAAQRAIELDRDLSEGYVALASINWFYDWDWAAAERNYRRSFSVNRLVYTRCICYVWYLAALGEVDGAVREAKRARSFDPVSLLPMLTLADVYLATGRTTELRALLPELRIAGAADGWLSPYVAWLEWDAGRRAPALAMVERRTAFPDSLATADPWALATSAYMYGGTGRKDRAARIARILSQRAADQYVQPLLVASAYASAGDTVAAGRWIRRAFGERENLAFLALLPEMRSLAGLPAFQQALRSAGVPRKQ